MFGVTIILALSVCVGFLVGVRATVVALFLGLALMGAAFFVDREAAFVLFLPGLFLTTVSSVTFLVRFLIKKYWQK